MKVSGFTIVRNAVKFDYTVVESIKSVLPLCDEFIVLVGNSDDGTEELINNISSPKIKIHHSVWDDSLREGGLVLSAETNKAKALVSPDSDWLIYIQADEVIHEKYHSVILDEMQSSLNDSRIEGLLFKYLHFYGSYSYVADSRKWYRREIRIIRNEPAISSHGDAQGFRLSGRKLKVKLIDAYVYHYGWVKDPYKQKLKEKTFNRLWHSDEWMQKNIRDGEQFDYSGIDSLQLFSGSHPEVMKKRIANADWSFEHSIKVKNMNFSSRLLYLFEKLTGKRPFEYRNYELIN